MEEVEEVLKQIKIRDSTKEGFSVLGIWTNSNASKLISIQKSQEKAQQSSHGSFFLLSFNFELESRIVWITVEKDSISNLPSLK